MAAIFKIKRRFQKRRDITFEDIVTEEVLQDLCQKLTGQINYELDWDDSSYNKGRLAVLEFNENIFYISFSFSAIENSGRNSFFQSFPTAYIKFLQEENSNKGICFYFLPFTGNIETSYFVFMYRLMKTLNTIFLNEDAYLSTIYQPFNSVSDVIINRDANRVLNSGNASTYAATDETNSLQIFGKTFGANKFETILITLAFKNLTEQPIEVYEIQEGNLSILPEPGRQIIINSGINVITSDLTLERREFETNDSLRSPTYLYNLLDKLGHKKCSLCACEIPQIIHGAHIWPVASIRRANNLNLYDQIQHATSGDNGLWLCGNHHKLFDINFLYISPDGRWKYQTNIEQNHELYLRDITTYSELPSEILTQNFLDYLDRRNQIIDEGQYSYIA